MNEHQEPNRPFSYVRVSSSEQDLEDSLGRQRDAVGTHATERDLDIQEEYVDQGPGDNHTPTQEA